jgi:hypothetical protein
LECIYEGIAFGIAWVVMNDSELRKRLALDMGDSALEGKEEFASWARRMYNGKDRKWRNCGTWLIVWYHRKFFQD